MLLFSPWDTVLADRVQDLRTFLANISWFAYKTGVLEWTNQPLCTFNPREIHWEIRQTPSTYFELIKRDHNSWNWWLVNACHSDDIIFEPGLLRSMLAEIALIVWKIHLMFGCTQWPVAEKDRNEATLIPFSFTARFYEDEMRCMGCWSSKSLGVSQILRVSRLTDSESQIIDGYTVTYLSAYDCIVDAICPCVCETGYCYKQESRQSRTQESQPYKATHFLALFSFRWCTYNIALVTCCDILPLVIYILFSIRLF